MTTPATESALRSAAAAELLPPPDYSHLEPLPDPPRQPDMQQDNVLFFFHAILEIWYAGRRRDVLIAGQGFLRHDPYNEDERFAPDCVVAFGVNPRNIISRNGYVISEVGKPPDFVIEVASRSTGRRDYTVKREGYARYGVGEYWRFDHTGGRFHDAPLAGDLLVDRKYERLPIHSEPDGLIWGHSPVLGLDLCWDAGEFRFRDPTTGYFLPTPKEIAVRTNQVEAERDMADNRADYAETQRDFAQVERDLARNRANRAENRAAEAEAENTRLRERLRRLEEN